MTRQEITEAVKVYKAARNIGPKVLFSRGTKVWWLHYYGYGKAEIEVQEYGIN